MSKSRDKMTNKNSKYYCTTMHVFNVVLVRLALLHFLALQVHSATVEDVKLIGDMNDYINVRTKAPYSLRCAFRAAYDDPIESINWYKDKRLVYRWREGETTSTAYLDLNGRVATTGENLQNIRFNNNLSLTLEGNYTCEVVSKKETVKSNPFHLVVLDIPSDDFISEVNLLTSSSNDNLRAENETVNLNCTLLWDFKTPAIFPRPNVTCGYFSYLHDDVTSSLPAGLTMELLTNGSWQAGFEHTQISVSEIPRAERLGCTVRVPDTSYKKVIKFEDNFVIDHLIDSQGCNSSFLEPEYGLEYDIVGGERNCRGDVVPSSTEQPLQINIRCPRGKIAVFINGTAVAYWSTQMTCDQTDFTWSRVRYGQPSERVRDTRTEIPICVQNGNPATTVSSSTVMSILLFSSLLWYTFRY